MEQAQYIQSGPADLAQASLRLPVTIVMCTYQGASHVDAQMCSLLAQSWPVRLLVADDASTDATVDKVRSRLRTDVDRLLTHEINVGYVKNFERTLQCALDSGAAYVALSDQDDIWTPERIAEGMRAMHALERRYGSALPLLVHSDLQLIDETGQPLHDSFLGYRRYRIQNTKDLSLVLGENGVMGNTILMNRALANLALPFPDALHVHDYWLAVIAELFGERRLLTEPLVSYRLHRHNASNPASTMQAGWQSKLLRAFNGTLLNRNFKLPFKEDSRLAVLELLAAGPPDFPPLRVEQQAELDAFIRYLRFEQPRLSSLAYLLASGVTRGDLLHRARLCLATLLTKRYPRAR